VLMFLIAFVARGFVLALPWAFMETVLMMTGVGAGASLGWLLTHSSSPYAGLYIAGLVPIVVYGNLVQRFRFRFAFVFSLIIIGISVACAIRRYGQSLPFDLFDFPLVMLVSGYTLIMNYRLELEERRRFEMAVRASALHKKLSASRAQLDLMSRRDPLTGAPNRREFEGYVRERWEALARAGGEMALL